MQASESYQGTVLESAVVHRHATTCAAVFCLPSQHSFRLTTLVQSQFSDESAHCRPFWIGFEKLTTRLTGCNLVSTPAAHCWLHEAVAGCCRTTTTHTHRLACSIWDALDAQQCLASHPARHSQCVGQHEETQDIRSCRKHATTVQHKMRAMHGRQIA